MFSNPRPSPHPTYLLVGNYGVHNAGDEILRAYFLERFPEIEWKVLSASPKAGELSRIPAGLRSLLSFGWVQTVRELRRSEGMVFGGGSLFTDAESVRACLLWFLHAVIARLFRKPLFLAFQGIGPLETGVGEWCARWVLCNAMHISVRDQASFDRVKTWKKSTKVTHSFDPSLSLLKEENGKERTKNVIIYIPRFSTTGIIEKKEILAQFLREGARVQILSLQPSDPRERALCVEFATFCDGEILYASSLASLTRDIAQSSRVITERFHGGMLALSQCIPFIALWQTNGDKLQMLAQCCGCPGVQTSQMSVHGLPSTDWEKVISRLPAVRRECLNLIQSGENELRRALHSHHSPER